MLASLPQGSTLIATDVATPFFTPFKLALVVSIALAIPVLLWQLWAFVAPGLYKRKAFGHAIDGFEHIALLCGHCFCLLGGFASSIELLGKCGAEGVTVATDIARYLDFVLPFLWPWHRLRDACSNYFALLDWRYQRQILACKAAYVIVVAFVVGMILTLPDVISQTLLAIPMWLLFELGLLIASLYQQTPRSAEPERE